MRIILALLSASLIYADTGWLINNASPRRVASWTVTSAYQNITTMRLEGRITGIVCPASNGDYKLIGSGSWSGSFPQFGIGLRVNGATCSIWGWNTRDGLAGGEAQAAIPLAGRTDVYFRYQRDPNGGVFVNDSQPRMLFQIWLASNAADKVTFNQSSNASIIGTLNQYASTWGGPFTVGDDFTQIPVGDGTANVAWVKVYDTILGPGADAPKACDPGAFGAWQFEGNANDSSGNGRNLTPTNASYVTTPDITTAAPRTFGAPFWTNMIPFRAGNTNQLDGSTSYSDELTCGMTYQWTQLNAGTAPSVLAWSSRTASQPTVTGALFGQYDVQLTAVSPAGRTSTVTLAVGSVATDPNGVAIVSDTAASTVLGQQITFGRSAWPYLDDRHKALADYYGGLLTTRYAPVWRTLLTGTVAVTNNTLTITGTGTNFSGELDCQTSREAGDFIAIRYPDAAVQGGYRYRASKAKTCTTTSITLDLAWDGPTVSGASFGKFPTSEYGYWTGGGDNANYYDNVMAHYSMYYRTGLTVYRDFARELADRWIESPLRDYYGSNGAGGYWLQNSPRVMALSGIMMRAKDGRSDFWDQIWTNLFEGGGFGFNYKWTSLINTATYFGNRDPREEGYVTAYMSLFKMLNPDSGRSSTVSTIIDRYMTNMWSPLLTIGSNGGQRNYYTDRVLGQAVFTNGSTSVTSSGLFPAGACAYAAVVDRPTRIWAMSTGAGAIWANPANDATSYECTRNSDSSITLSTPYTGTSGTKWFTLEGINGPAVQPFMQGIVGRGMAYATAATGNAAALSHIQSTSDYLVNEAWRPSAKAINYITGGTDSDCKTTPTNVFCVIDEAGSDNFARDFQAEIIGAISSSYLANPAQPTLLSRGDIWQGALYGAAGYGGPQTGDGYYSQTLSLPTSRQGKYYGFFFGFGGGPNWDAARLGGVAPVDTKTVRLSYVAPGGTSATSATYVAPSGASSTVSCSGGGCNLPTDWRQGNYLYRLTHTVTNGTVAGDLVPLKVQ